MRAIIGLVFLAAAVAGCGGDRGERIVIGGPVPVSVPVYRIAVGFSTVVGDGAQPGYGITANLGGSYRLVFTDAGNGDIQFFGSVWTEGRFESLDRSCAGKCVVHPGDVVSGPIAVSGGERVDFSTVTGAELSGFDFVVGGGPVFFDLAINGIRDRSLVFFPSADSAGAVVNPGTIPFGLVM